MRRIVLAAALCLAAAATPAQVIRIPLGAQGSAAAAERLPAPGATASEVLSLLGEPEQRHPATGEPPIVRWDYADFSVYFENDRVLHCVLRHRPANPVN